jgi:hypothetical protein
VAATATLPAGTLKFRHHAPPFSAPSGAAGIRVLSSAGPAEQPDEEENREAGGVVAGLLPWLHAATTVWATTAHVKNARPASRSDLGGTEGDNATCRGWAGAHTESPSRTAFLEDLPLGFRPRLRQFPQHEPLPGEELAVAENLRFPAVRLALKAQFTTPGDVLAPEGPDGSPGRGCRFGETRSGL